jgi:hypothetical protein
VLPAAHERAGRDEWGEEQPARDPVLSHADNVLPHAHSNNVLRAGVDLLLRANRVLHDAVHDGVVDDRLLA